MNFLYLVVIFYWYLPSMKLVQNINTIKKKNASRDMQPKQTKREKEITAITTMVSGSAVSEGNMTNAAVRLMTKRRRLECVDGKILMTECLQSCLVS
jgi:hypothetical protein